MSTVSQRSFAGGELAPALYARVDTAKYATGLRRMRNFFIMRHGGAANRAGTGFVSEIKDSTKKSRLIPFIFNADQAYVLEFTPGVMRILYRGEMLTTTGISVAEGGVPIEVSVPYNEASLPDLKFAQSADVLTIVHPNYAPMEVKRIAATYWTCTAITFGAGIAAPVASNPTYTYPSSPHPDAGPHFYVVTAVKENGEESLPSNAVGNTGPKETDLSYYMTVSWSAVSGAVEYNVYKRKNGVWGFLGVAVGTSFVDNVGAEPDLNDTPPVSKIAFDGASKYPSTVAYVQQRRAFANSMASPESVWLSRTGRYSNFTTSSPSKDDDAISFTMLGQQVNQVRHLLFLGKLLALTSGGEWAAEGGSDGVLTPTQINLKQYTYNGSGGLAPIVAGDSAIYLQARGSIVRTLGFDFQVDGYRGNDLTIFSAHLFDGHTLVDWAYQQTPHSIVWAVRDDGTLLGLTYVREQEIIGWHRHDFDGLVENVCVVPEGTEDALYLVIKRTINGATKRYIERMKTRQIKDVVDSVFLDCSLSYDGRNAASNKTMTISGGTTWDYLETLTLTASAVAGWTPFTSSDIGNAIHLKCDDGSILRFTITGYTSATVVTGKAHKTVPECLRGIATASWTKAVDEVGGLSHLEGKKVSIFADGFVVANPNNPAYVVRTVSSGKVALDKPYGVIHVGLPITSDIETLDIDTAQGETLADKKKNVSRVTMHIESSRGAWVSGRAPDGDSIEGMTELKMRNDEGYDDPVDLVTGTVGVNIFPEWNSNGRVFIRQTDPLPLSVLAIAPSGLFPFKG